MFLHVLTRERTTWLKHTAAHIYLLLCIPQASEEVSKCLVSMKEILYGSNDKEPHTETVAQLAQELYNSGLLMALVENLQVIDFEVRRA